MTDVDMAGPLLAWATPLHESHGAEVVLMDYCGTDNVSLSHQKISQVYRLRSGVRQPHKLCLRARLRDNLLL